MQCKNCGANIQEGATFCMNCGASCETPQVEAIQQSTMVLSTPTQQNISMQPNMNQNNKKKMYIIIAGIIILAVIAIVVVLLMSNKNTKESSKPNSNTQSNSTSNSNSNSGNNTNTNGSSNSNINSSVNMDDDNTVTVSGGEIEFNGYKFNIPSNYEAEVSHWEYLGDAMNISNKDNYHSFDMEVEKTPYASLKSNLVALKDDVSSGGYYTVGEVQYKNYNGKEYLVVSRTSEEFDITHMIAYVSLSDTETLIIDGTNDYYELDYELFSEIAPIIETAHK